MKNSNLRLIAPATSSGPTVEVSTAFTDLFQGTKFTTHPVAGSALNLYSNGLSWSRRIQIRFGLPISFAIAKCSWVGREAARNRCNGEADADVEPIYGLEKARKNVTQRRKGSEQEIDVVAD